MTVVVSIHRVHYDGLKALCDCAGITLKQLLTGFTRRGAYNELEYRAGLTAESAMAIPVGQRKKLGRKSAQLQHSLGFCGRPGRN